MFLETHLFSSILVGVCNLSIGIIQLKKLTMKINITATNLDLTPAYREYIEERLNSLDKFMSKFDPEAVQAWVVAARTTKHHKHGDVYHAEINLKFPGEVLRARAEGSDARAVVDEAKDKLKQEIIKLKDRKTDH